MLILNIFGDPQGSKQMGSWQVLNLPKAPTAITNQLPLSTDPSHAPAVAVPCWKDIWNLQTPKASCSLPGKGTLIRFSVVRTGAHSGTDLVIAKIRTPKGLANWQFSEHPVDSQTSYIAHQVDPPSHAFWSCFRSTTCGASFFAPKMDGSKT